VAEVQLEKVSKIFPGGVVAVSDATLKINDKEFLVLVGPSGCGKSTFLRMIAGLEEPTQGTIKIGGEVVNDIPPKNRDIAMVFQNYALYPHMTVYKNMAFGLKLRHFPKAEIDERVKEAARILGITKLLDRKPKALSGGQRQRVAVGRAIVRQPKAFLFDEPLSNLDAKLRVEMRAELKKLHRRLQSTMIYVTHDQVEAMTLGDRIVVMNDGVVQQVDNPLNVYDYPENMFVAGFIGTPPMNFLKGRLVQENSRFYFDEGTVRILLPQRFISAVARLMGNPLTLGIRPEDLFDLKDYTATVNNNVVRATANVVEPLGNEMIVYFSTRTNEFIGKFDAHHRIAMGQEMQLVFDMDKIHLFDNDSGKNIALEKAHPRA
jgi:multiple sugar transport system ATP-binding protein